MKIVNNPNMKTIKDKKLVVGADFAGYPPKRPSARIRAPRAGRSRIWASRTNRTTALKTCSTASACAWARR